MRVGGVLVRFYRVPMGLFRVLVRCSVVAALVVLGCRVMRLGGVLMVLCCLLVRFMCHVCRSSWELLPPRLTRTLGPKLFSGAKRSSRIHCLFSNAENPSPQ